MTVNAFPSVAIVSGFALGENGRVDLTEGTPDVFIGGMPIDTGADVSVGESGGAVEVYNGGTALTSEGKIVFIDLQDDPVPATANYTDGLPHSGDGTLYVSSTAPIASYAHQVPMAITGAVAVETIVAQGTRLKTSAGDLLTTAAGNYFQVGGNDTQFS